MSAAADEPEQLPGHAAAGEPADGAVLADGVLAVEAPVEAASEPLIASEAAGGVKEPVRSAESPANPVPAKRQRAPLWTYVLIVVGSLLLVASIGVVITAKLTLSVATGSVTRIEVPAINEDGAGQPRHASVIGAKTILLVGVDPHSPAEAAAAGIRSDSIIMLHITASHDQAYLISIPRDTLVEIPAYDNGVQHNGQAHNKINAAFSWGALGLSGSQALAGGLDLLAKTIKANWAITFDAAAIVDFGGFHDIVDYIGGVDMYIDEWVKSVHIGNDSDGRAVTPGMRQSADLHHFYYIPGVTPVTYQKGWRHFVGWDALDYCRQRDVMELNDTDYGRQRHQQQFIKAVFKKITNEYLSSPTRLPSLIKMVGRTLTVSEGGISMADWMFAMRDIRPESLVTIKTNAGQFNSTPDGTYELMSEASKQLLDSINTDTVDQFVASHLDWVSTS